jgi:hypothetical protein
MGVGAVRLVAGAIGLIVVISGCGGDPPPAAPADEQADQSGWTEDVAILSSTVIAVDWDLGWMLEIPDSGPVPMDHRSGNLSVFSAATPVTRQRGWIRYELPDRAPYYSIDIGVENPVYKSEFAANKDGFAPVVCLLNRSDRKGNCALGAQRDQRPGWKTWSTNLDIVAQSHTDWWRKLDVLVFTTYANWLKQDAGFTSTAESEDFYASVTLRAFAR